MGVKKLGNGGHKTGRSGQSIKRIPERKIINDPSVIPKVYYKYTNLYVRNRRVFRQDHGEPNSGR